MSNTSRLRVLHLGSPTGLYGAERWILALVKYLPAGQIESFVGAVKDAPGPRPAICEQAAQAGFSTHVFESHGKLSWSAVGQLRSFIRENGISILHTHFYKMDLLGGLAVRGTDCRIVTTPHGWSRNAGLKLQIYETLDRLSFYFLDAVAPLSADLHEGLRRWPGLSRKLHFIRNGVDLSEVDAAPATSPELQAFKAGGDLIIGYIGQLIPRKGLDTLIRAFGELNLPQARLCLIGEGPQRAQLEALAAGVKGRERIHFFGFREDRLSMLKCFDVFVLPSTLEGIPRCVMESMAAEVPVVATDIPGCRDVVTDNVTGCLVPVGDVGVLTATLRTLLTDSRRRQLLARAGHELVRSEYSAATMAARYTQLYATLAAQGPGVSGQLAASPADAGSERR